MHFRAFSLRSRPRQQQKRYVFYNESNLSGRLSSADGASRALSLEVPVIRVGVTVN